MAARERRPNERALGAGEGSQRPAVAEIANAFAHATGKRVRDLPFHPDRVKTVLGWVAGPRERG